MDSQPSRLYIPLLTQNGVGSWNDEDAESEIIVGQDKIQRGQFLSLWFSEICLNYLQTCFCRARGTQQRLFRKNHQHEEGVKKRTQNLSLNPQSIDCNSSN
jgi:hypothetical protein